MKDYKKNYVVRINLKTDLKTGNGQVNRTKFINECLNVENQFLAIGWSYVYRNNSNINSFVDYYYAVKKSQNRIPAVLNIFWYIEEDDLFWTRDLDGFYWICRAKGKAETRYDETMDIGAVVPVEAYKYGKEVPGKIKASFNRPRGGTSERIYEEYIIEYSKKIFNEKSGKDYYEISHNVNQCILDNLPDFDLEELVISFIQIKRDYYVLSNSIANKSTTIKIECEFRSRNLNDRRKAVVQVKGGNQKTIDANDYKNFIDEGYEVYLYAPNISNIEESGCIRITSDELENFYSEYKEILPDSITIWESIL